MKKIVLLMLAMLLMASLSLAGEGQKEASGPTPLHVVMYSPERPDADIVIPRMNDLLTNEIDSTVDFTFVGPSNWAQQTNLMLAGGEEIDVLWTSSIYGYSSAVAKNQLLPLDDLLKEKGQDIIDVVGYDVLEACKVNGEIYAVPSTRDMAADWGIAMRKDILEECGIDASAVTSIDDLYEVFETVKKKYPDMIMTGAHSNSVSIVQQLIKGQYDFLDDWLGVVKLDDESGNIVNIFETAEYRDLCEAVHDWYKAGYIAPDAATSTEIAWDLIRADRQFSMIHSFKPGIEEQLKANTGYDMVAVRLTPVVQTTSSITIMMASIPMTCENPEKAMELLNLWYANEDFVNLFDHGVEGVHYEKVDGNIIRLPEGRKSVNDGWPSKNYVVGNNYLSYLWEGYDPDLWNKMEVFNKGAFQSPLLGLTFNLKDVKTDVASVSNVLSEYRIALETGTLDPQKRLDEFIDKLKQAGIENIIAEKQQQTDAWLKNK